MRIEWVNQQGGGQVVVFFNGWGMDRRAVSHLACDGDLLLISDYRKLEPELLPDLSAYGEVRIAAWSMGVWAAFTLLPDWGVPCNRLVGLNGTALPVDNRYGIPEAVYRLTERGMNEQGREKFFARMFTGETERRRFRHNAPERELPEQLEELAAIREAGGRDSATLHWSNVYVSEGDVIFPTANQRAFWENRCVVTPLPGGHYPFYRFGCWDEIFEGTANDR
ncbi:MAG: DUF452 family protein [Culturomica sp.]|jgi:biotin synthesis protein BioG|nr:DUF452 family protein [Culturomica sp.]